MKKYDTMLTVTSSSGVESKYFGTYNKCMAKLFMLADDTDCIVRKHTDGTYSFHRECVKVAVCTLERVDFAVL